MHTDTPCLRLFNELSDPLEKMKALLALDLLAWIDLSV
jgi:hypothetical protein